MRGTGSGTEQKYGKSDTENGRPVYARKLPPGRKLTGAAPGRYCADGTFVPWDSLSSETEEYTDDCVRGPELVFLDFSGEPGGVFVVPEGIAALGAGVFAGCCADAVVLPSSLVSIGDSAFRDSGIVSAVLPAGLRRIGNDAFRDSHISSAVLPEKLGSAAEFCFSGIRELRTAAVLSSRAYCGCGVFSGSGLRAFTGRCPEGSAPFENCRELAAADIHSCRSVPPEAFCGCCELACVLFPEGTETIGKCAFARCGNLTSVRLPDSLRSAGEGAFMNCIGLSSVKYGGEKCRAWETAFAGTPVRHNGNLPSGISAERLYA